MVVIFEVFKWGLFLLRSGTARGPSGVNASIVHMFKLALSYILIRNKCVYDFLLA